MVFEIVYRMLYSTLCTLSRWKFIDRIGFADVNRDVNNSFVIIHSKEKTALKVLKLQESNYNGY